MPESLEDKRKTDPVALRDVSVSGEDMSTSGSFPTDFTTFESQLTTALNDKEIDTSVLNSLEDTPYSPSESNINGVAVPGAIMAAHMDGSDLAGSYRTILDEYASSGKSKTLEGILGRNRQEDHQVLMEHVQGIMADPLSTPEQVEGALALFERGVDLDINLDKNAMAELAITSSISERNIKESRKVQDFLVNSIDNIASSRQNIRELYSKHKTDIDKNAVGLFTDSFLSLMPFNYSVSIDNVIEDLQEKGTLPNGVEGSLGLDFLTPGEAIKAMRDELNKLSGSERVNFAESIMESIKDNAGLLGGNAALQVQMMDGVFNSFLGEGTAGDDEFGRWLDNAAGILDAVALGQGLKNSIGVLRNTNTIRNVAAGSPDVEAAVASDVIADNTGSLATTMNTTTEEVVEGYVMPRPRIRVQPGEAVPIVPGRVAQVLQDIQDTGTEVADLSRSNPFNYPEALDEEILLIDDELKEFADLETETLSKAHYNQAMSTREYNPDTNLMDFGAVFARTDTHGFNTASNAMQDALSRIDQKYHSSIKILSRDGDSASPISGNIADQEPGEFFYRVDASVPLSKEYINDSKILFDPESIHVAPFGTDFILSPEAKLPWLSRRADRATDLSIGIANKFMTVFEKHFVKGLNSGQQKRVNKVLEMGSDEGVVYSQTDLLNFGLSPKEVDAYYISRQVSDVFWLLDNQQRSATLKALDMRHVYIDDIQFETFGNQLSVEKATSVTHVYDPRAREVVRVAPDDIEGLYRSGGSIIKTEKALGSATKATHTILRHSDEAPSNPVIGDIPSRVLHYNNGHISRYYKENFFVVKKQKVKIDGVEKQISVARAASTMQKDAMRSRDTFISELSEDDLARGITYEVRPARELDIDDISRHRDQVRPKGGPRFGKRGDKLKSSDDMLADVASPMESLIKTANALSRDRGFGDLVDSSKSRWMNTFSKFAKESVDGRKVFPATEDFFDKSKRFDPEYTKALTAYRYIKNNLESVNNNRQWKSSMIHLANWLDSKGDSVNRPIAKYIQENIGDNGNPIKLLRSLAFHMFIAANPVRQAVLQAQQFSFIAAVNPVLAGKALKSKPLLDTGMAIINNPTMLQKADSIPLPAIKAAGFESKKEWLETVRAFKESGLPASIDSHSFARDAVHNLENSISSGTVSTAINKSMRVAGYPLKVAKAVGFDFGEYTNLSSTWLLARERFIKNAGKKPKSRLDWDEIGADARQLALSMTPSGSLKYQQEGLASLMTQFFSVQHKAWLAMLPRKFGSKAFTNAEKARVAVGQFLFWGAGGFGLNKAYEGARDSLGLQPDPALDTALSHGSAELVINSVLSNITGERQDIALEGFAPAGGMYDTTLTWAQALLMGVGSPLEIAPAASALSRLDKVTGLLYHTMNVPDIDTSEKLSRAIKTVGMYSSGGSNFLKASAAMKYGHFVSTSGDFVSQATYEEAIAQGLIGLTTREYNDYYNIQSSGPRSEIRMSALNDIAQEMFVRTKQSVTLLSDNGDYTNTNYGVLEEAIRTESMVVSALEPNDAQEVLRMFRSKVLTDHTETKVDSLLSSMILGAMRNNLGNDYESTLIELKNSGIVTTPEKEEEVRKLLEYVHKHVDLTKEEE